MWILKVCPECNEAVTLVHAPVHKAACSRPNCVQIEVQPTAEGYAALQEASWAHLGRTSKDESVAG